MSDLILNNPEIISCAGFKPGDKIIFRHYSRKGKLILDVQKVEFNHNGFGCAVSGTIIDGNIANGKLCIKRNGEMSLHMEF